MDAAATDRIEPSLRRGVGALRHLQRSDGSWCGMIEGDSTLESEYLLMKFILHQESAPMADGRGRDTLDRIAAGLRSQQRTDGAWGACPGSGPDLSATVKGYLALKLMGDDPEAPHMCAARKSVLANGGAECSDDATRIYLACLGQLSWNAVASIPPEIILLPEWSVLRAVHAGVWARPMLQILSVVTTRRPTRRLPSECGIKELYVDRSKRNRRPDPVGTSGARDRLRRGVDRGLKLLDALGGTPLRGIALRRAVDWMLRSASTGGFGGHFASAASLQIALHAMGRDRSDPAFRRVERELDGLLVEVSNAHGEPIIRMQPGRSPAWDTGNALDALTACGLDEHDPSVRAAADWLDGRPGSSGAEARVRRGVIPMLEAQNDDGGWSGFDRTTGCWMPECVPLADRHAVRDRSSPDVTGLMLERLARHGCTVEHPDVGRAVSYLRRKQTRDGAWIGGWGVNYIHGTWRAVVGSIRSGVEPSEQWLQRAGLWLRSVQKADGSFGESSDSSAKGQGPASASQTAWGAMAMQAIYGHEDEGVRRAIDWLAATQLAEREASDPTINPDGDPAGSWSEPWWTGVDFTRGLPLRFHMHRLCYPVLAIACWLEAERGGPPIEPMVRMEPKLITT